MNSVRYFLLLNNAWFIAGEEFRHINEIRSLKSDKKIKFSVNEPHTGGAPDVCRVTVPRPDQHLEI